jgi:hypothetical protein
MYLCGGMRKTLDFPIPFVVQTLIVSLGGSGFWCFFLGFRFALVFAMCPVRPTHAPCRHEQDDLRDEYIKAAGLRPASKACNLMTCYDERGALYEVPMYALRAPDNLDGEPRCQEFKDAAAAVIDLLETSRPPP